MSPRRASRREPRRSRRVRALVDTGSTDCELRGETVQALGLPETGEAAAGAARVVYQTCARSPLLLSGRGARAMLLRAGSEAEPHVYVHR